MAIDETLASRVREVFAGKGVAAEEKRMMGGLCFMVDGKMCVGIVGNRLMVRLDPDIYEECLKRPGCVPMDFTGRPMRGFVFVNPVGTKSDRSLRFWIELALDYNPRARSSKPKKPKTKKASTSGRNSATAQRRQRDSERSSP
jgi:TfoX/Sxy family transcriptional regulator of competence genes